MSEFTSMFHNPDAKSLKDFPEGSPEHNEYRIWRVWEAVNGHMPDAVVQDIMEHQRAAIASEDAARALAAEHNVTW